MIVLIDYDNLDRIHRQGSLDHVITRLLRQIEAHRLAGHQNVTCRLYGGWLTEDLPSRRAENLIPQLRSRFPFRFRLRGPTVQQGLVVRAELARSLACDPSVDLRHTHRVRSLPPNLLCDGTPFELCLYPASCPISSLETFINNADCPARDCAVAPRTVLSREEQKLVDSMIVVDLIHFAQTTKELLVVVSADDDLWPGIRFVLLLGKQVIHLIPKRSRGDLKRYRSLETTTYQQVLI